jgi:hypothetical protein
MAQLQRQKMSVRLCVLTSFALLLSFSEASAGEPFSEAIPPKSFCDMGYFEIGGKVMSYAEIIVEGNRTIEFNNQGPITAYGYIKDIDMAKDPMDPTRAKIFGIGECWKPLGKAASDSMMDIDILFEPSEIAAEEYKRLRMSLLQLGSDSFNSRALVKVTGNFKMYSNTFEQYFSATTVDVVATAN